MQPIHPAVPAVSEAFIGRYRTAEGYPVLVGGLGPKGCSATCAAAFSALSQTPFGLSRDGVVIDAQLARLLRTLAPKDMRFLAASIHVPDASEPCGGVAGDIASSETSADGSFSQLAPAVYGFAFPGAGALIYAGEEQEAQQFYRLSRPALSSTLMAEQQIAVFLERAASFPGAFLFVSDGSGGSIGCVSVKAEGLSSSAWLHSPAGFEKEQI